MSCANCGTTEGNIASRSRACGCLLCPGCDRIHNHTTGQWLRRPYQGILQ